MAEIKGYAFDIEGTLYKNGQLQKGAAELFKNIEKTGKPIMFISGMNSTEMKGVIDKINTQSKTTINPIIASNAGSYINGKNDIKFSPLSSTSVNEVKKVVDLIAPGSVIVYRTPLNNYREKAIEAKTIPSKIKKGFTYALIAILEAMKKVELNCVPITMDKIADLQKENQIFSIDILALPKYSKKLAKELSKFQDIYVSNGASVQISSSNKWNALQTIFGDDAKNICYFGDSQNDTLCLKNCDKAILANSKKEEMYDIIETEIKNGKDKYATNNLADNEMLKYVLGEGYSKKFMEDLTAKSKASLISKKISLSKKKPKEMC